MSRMSVEIAEALESAILKGEFASGKILDELALASRFGVSRTPIREALIRLSGTGLVELRRGAGAVVVGITLDALFDAYEVLACELGLAGVLAARRMSQRQRAELRMCMDELARQTTRDLRERYIETEEAMHEAILFGANNQVLADNVRRSKRRIAAVRNHSIRSHQTMDAILPELERYVALIVAGDAAAAREAIETHVSIRGDGAQKLMALWRELQSSAA